MYSILVIVSILLVINVFFLLLRYSNHVQDFTIRTALKWVNNHFQGEIDYDTLEGNLFTEFTITGARIYDIDGENEIGRVDRVTANWNYREVFRGRVNINWVEIHGAYADLWFYTRRINMAQVFRRESDRGIDAPRRRERRPEEQRRSPFNVIINNIKGYQISADFLARGGGEFIPSYSVIETMAADFRLINRNIYINASFENISGTDPDVQLDNIDTSLRIRPRRNISIDKLDIFTENSLVSGSASADFLRNFRSLLGVHVEMEFNPLSVGEFISFVPERFARNMGDMEVVSVKINASMGVTDADIHITFREDDVQLYTHLFVEKYHDILYHNFFEYSNNVVLDATLQNFDVFRYANVFTGRESALSSVLNGNVSLHGRNANIHNTEANLYIDLINSHINHIPIDELNINTVLYKKDADINLRLTAGNGEIYGTIRVKDIISEQDYSVLLNISAFDVSKIAENLNSEINATLNITGKHFHPDDMTARLVLDISDSYFIDEKIDAVLAVVDIKSGRYELSELFFFNSALEIGGIATATNHELLNSDIRIFVKEPHTVLERLFGLNMDFRAFVHLEADGQWTDLRGNVFVGMDDIRYNDIFIESFQSYHRINSLSDMGSNNQIYLSNVAVSSVIIDDVFLDIVSSHRSAVADLRLQSEDLFNASFSSNLRWEDSLEMNIFDVFLYNEYINWSNKYDFRMVIDSENLLLDGFNIHSGNQSIVAEHVEKRGDDISLNISIQNLAIREALRNFDEGLNLDGLLTFTALGELKNNVLSLNTDLEVEGLSVFLKELNETVSVDQLRLRSVFNQDRLWINNVIRRREEELEFAMSLPLMVDVKNNELALIREESLYMNLSLDSFDISFINTFLPRGNSLQGNLSINLGTAGAVASPSLNGNVTLSNGSFRNRDWGINYTNINSDLSFRHRGNQNIVSVENFSFNSGRGSLNLDGFSTVMFNLGAEDHRGILEVGETSFAIRMDNLQVTNSRALRSNLSGRVNLFDVPNGDTESLTEGIINFPNFSLNGRVNTNELRMNLDELMRMTGTITVPEPILVTAQMVQADTSTVQQARESHFRMPEFDINLSIDFPRNVWVQGMDMNVELRGAGTIRRNQNEQLIEGIVEVVRGSYNFWGKRFIFQEGVITFFGHELDNPSLNLVANYSFRRQVISLHLDGTLQVPEISFYLNGEPIEEVEAMSLIILGRGSEELTAADGQTLENNASVFQEGTMMMLGQITSQLTQLIQDQLHFDLLEIRGDSQWQEASMTIGRYFGHNLFVSYETDFDISGLRTQGTDRWSAEYQINRYFYLSGTQSAQGDRGIDLIFRRQWR